jgi:small-conductance mechanosensitive channel
VLGTHGQHAIAVGFTFKDIFENFFLSEDVHTARAVIRKSLEGCATVHKDRAVEVFVKEVADRGANFEVTWWAGPAPVEQRELRDEVLAAVKRALDSAGIERQEQAGGAPKDSKTV